MYILLFILLLIPFGYFIFIEWFTWSRRGKIEGKLTLIMGKVGSGKSTNMAMIVRDAIKKNRKVYSNAHVLGAIKLEHTDLGKFNLIDCDIIIDEGQLFYDSRDFKSFSSENKFFFSHFRHFGCRVFILSQSFEDLDVKIRRQAQCIYICQPFIKGLMLMEKVGMKFSVSEDETDIVTLYKTSIFNLRIRLGFLAWKYFDSYCIPYLPQKEEISWGEIPFAIKNQNKTRKFFKDFKEKR